MLKPLSKHIRTAESECDTLATQVSDLKERNVVLERSQQIDREVSRNLSKQIKEAQDKRLALEQGYLSSGVWSGKAVEGFCS